MDEQGLDDQLEPIYNSSVVCSLEDLPVGMENRDEWREKVGDICASGMT